MGKLSKTLRFRFALWVAGLVLAVLIFFGFYVYQSMAQGLAVAADNALTLSAAQVAAGLDIEAGRFIPSDSLTEDEENADLRGRGFTVRILSPQGEPLQEFGPYRALPFTAEPSFATHTHPTGASPIRIYNLPVQDNGQLAVIVQVAQSLEDVQSTLERLLLTLLISVPFLVTVAGVSGYFLAARALKPIDHVTLTARRISAENLSARLNLPAADDEVGRLTQTFDAMLGRLDAAMQRERQFTHDASHELRTPLTAMQAILGTTRAKSRTATEYELVLDDLAEEADRLRTLVENLLQLARSDQPSRRVRERVDISNLLRDVSDSLRPLAEAKQLVLTTSVSDSLTLMGDGDDLIRLFVNLLDNAIKYTERGAVQLHAAQNGTAINVTVADTGPGVSPEHLPHLFERFYRVDEARATHGVGLGLAIAQAIAHAHGGMITATSAVGRGTAFSVHLPINPSPRLGP